MSIEEIIKKEEVTEVKEGKVKNFLKKYCKLETIGSYGAFIFNYIAIQKYRFKYGL